MVIQIARMVPTKRIALIVRQHQHPFRQSSCLHATIGCSNAAIIVVCHIGGSVIQLMIVEIIPMSLDVQIARKLLHHHLELSHQKSLARVIDLLVIRADALSAPMFATVSQIVQVVKMKRIARRTFAEKINSDAIVTVSAWTYQNIVMVLTIALMVVMRKTVGKIKRLIASMYYYKLVTICFGLLEFSLICIFIIHREIDISCNPGFFACDRQCVPLSNLCNGKSKKK